VTVSKLITRSNPTIRPRRTALYRDGGSTLAAALALAGVVAIYGPNELAFAASGATSQPAATQPSQGGQASDTLPSLPEDTRLPVPPNHELRRDNQQLRAYFRDKYPLDTNLAEFRFYSTLFNHYVIAAKGTNHPAMRYAALMLIVRLATLQQDYFRTFQAISALAQGYKVNKYKLIVKAGRAMVDRGGMSPLTAGQLADQLTSFTLMAIEHVHFKSAEQLARIALTLANAVGRQQDVKLLIPMLVKARMAAPLEGEYQSAMRHLKHHPHSVGANTTVGLFLACFTKHRAKADSHLMKSGDPNLAAIAKRDEQWASKKSVPGSALITLAHGWLEISKNRSYRRFRRPIQNLAEGTATTALETIDQDILTALKAAQYHHAQSMLQDATQIASELNLTEFKPQIRNWRRTSAKLAALRSAYHQAIRNMNIGTGSADSCQAIGGYLCFACGRWKDGLAYLRHSKNQRIKHAAIADLRKPKSSVTQKSLGDMWWNVSEKYHGLERYNIRLRAIHWYKLCQKKLRGSALSEVIYREISVNREQF